MLRAEVLATARVMDEALQALERAQVVWRRRRTDDIPTMRSRRSG